MPRVVWAYTLYTQTCTANRQGKDWYSSWRRAAVYGNGLLRNAAALKSLWPQARMAVYVPENEVKVSTRAKQHTQKVLKALSKLANVDIVMFSFADVPKAEAMPLGQRLRCSRYLPFLTAGPHDIVVARDADSLITARDVQHVKAWQASGTEWLIYQEIMMGRKLPMGGGLAHRGQLPEKRWREAFAAGHAFDEKAMSDIFDTATQLDLENRAEWPRAKTQRSLIKRPTFWLLRTRMAWDGAYFEYASEKRYFLLWPDLVDDPHVTENKRQSIGRREEWNR